MQSSVVVKRTTFVDAWLLFCGKIWSYEEELAVRLLCGFPNGKFPGGRGWGRRNWTPCEDSRPCPDAEREKLAKFHFGYCNFHYSIHFHNSVGELIWLSIKWSSSVLITLSIIRSSSVRRILIVNPLSGPMVWSWFLIIISGKSNSFFCSSFFLDLFQLFVSYFLFTPNWGVSICAALKTKSSTVLSSLMVWVNRFGSALHSVDSMFLYLCSKIFHLSAQCGQCSFSPVLIISKTWKDTSIWILWVEKSFQVALGCSTKYSRALHDDDI